jgi:hypothetical protein
LKNADWLQFRVVESVVSLKLVQEKTARFEFWVCHSRASALAGARGIPDSGIVRAAASREVTDKGQHSAQSFM